MGGKVPPEGIKTLVKMSKPEGKFSFNITEKIINIKNETLENEKLIIPSFFEGGNNFVEKKDYISKQAKSIQRKKSIKYEINFLKSKESKGELKINCILINKCKGEWECILNDEEIESEIPKDIKDNKNYFKIEAERIIKQYDEEHKNDNFEITDIAKIGKWINKNIEYVPDYSKKIELTAIDILKYKKGVCFHYTTLFNAFIYSLGYQCIYVSGYANNESDVFSKTDSHSWSLIKINDKWFPFDATWGIFSGKLPVDHIFCSFFMKTVLKEGSKNIKLENSIVKGKYLE